MRRPSAFIALVAFVSAHCACTNPAAPPARTAHAPLEIRVLASPVDDFEDASAQRTLVLVSSASPSEGSAASREGEARPHYNQRPPKGGGDYFAEGDYKQALIEFTRAYELGPSYKLLYNIGLTQQELGRYPEAHVMLGAYLASGGTDIPPRRRADVERTMGELEARTGWLAIACTSEGVVVTTKEVGSVRCPMRKRWRVSIGEHVLVAERPAAPGSAFAELALELDAREGVAVAVGP